MAQSYFPSSHLGWGASRNRQEGECLFLGPRAHRGLFLPHSVQCWPCIKSFVCEVSVHEIHVIPAHGVNRKCSCSQAQRPRQEMGECSPLPRQRDGGNPEGHMLVQGHITSEKEEPTLKAAVSSELRPWSHPGLPKAEGWAVWVSLCPHMA